MRRVAKDMKKKCEVCGWTQTLHLHHIIPRCDKRCTDSLQNLAVLCPNCHNLVHSGDIIIVGVYSSTAGRKLMWFRKGEPPPLEESLWKIHPKDNPLVLREPNR